MKASELMDGFAIAIDRALDEAYTKGQRSGNAALGEARHSLHLMREELAGLRAIQQVDDRVFTFDGTCVAAGAQITIKLAQVGPKTFVFDGAKWIEHVHSASCYRYRDYQSAAAAMQAQCSAQWVSQANQGPLLLVCGK